MSKRINVNPDHYKGAGRERPGKSVSYEAQKREINRLRSEERRTRRRPQAPVLAAARSAGAGISNRLSPKVEARDRREHPSAANASRQADAAALREAVDGAQDRQTSRKAGSRSSARKAAGTRHTERPVPGSRKVAGAFGKEPSSQASDAATRRPEKRGRR